MLDEGMNLRAGRRNGKRKQMKRVKTISILAGTSFFALALTLLGINTAGLVWVGTNGGLNRYDQRPGRH
jgi:ligand-binding sensor domain-containing protein